MASDPPPPHNSPAAPPSAAPATSTATRAFTNPSPKKPIPLAPQLQPHHQPPYAANLSLRPPNPSPSPQLPKTHDTPHPLLYPVASSGRGFIPKPVRPQTSDYTGGFPLRSVVSFQQGVRGTPDPIGHPLHMMRPPVVHYQHSAGTGSAPIKGIPVSAHRKVALSPSSIPDSNGYKNVRDRSRDDSFSVLRERRVRISDGSSLYAMCRSWLKNGFHEEVKPHYMDGTKSLPRPLPIPVADTNLPKRKEDEDGEESAEQLSAKDLLKRHIKRAKKVRSRLREERLQRIARYKTRLALLLPPPVEPLRNDTAAGN